MTEVSVIEVGFDSDQSGRSLSQYWSEHLHVWQRSGLSQSEYCRQHGLKAHQFSYWKQKLLVEEAKRPTSSSGFVPVMVAPPSQGGLSLCLANGMEVHGITESNVVLVGRLLKHL